MPDVEKCRGANTHGVPSERAALFRNASSSICGCENCSVSEYSPGPVKDEEALHFVVTDPQWLLEDGKIHPAVFMRADQSGLSVLRDAASDKEFHFTMTELRDRADAAGKECFFHGSLKFTAQDVRYCVADRFMCVFDTGMKDKPHHADLMCPPIMPEGANWSKSKQQNERMALAKEIRTLVGNDLISPKSFRGGCLTEFIRS